MRFLRPGWLCIYVLLVLFFFWGGSGSKTLSFDEPVSLEQGDTLYGLIDDQSPLTKFRFKLFVRRAGIDVGRLQIGSYTQLQGDVSFEEFIAALEEGPQQSIVKVRLLEGRSSYDVDDYLTDAGLIESGEYLSYVANRDAIRQEFLQRGWYSENSGWSSDYSFLSDERLDEGLEGVLAPDTYHIDGSKPMVSQLVRLQLQSFATRVWPELQSARVVSPGEQNRLDRYDALVLASIVEKEERVDANKAGIAGVFFNRIDSGMRIDADISLCYGLGEGYESCTPQVIVANLRDASNPYNTRAVGGLPPTPIVSPTQSSIDSVLAPEEHDYLFYLHDMQGRIHFSETLAEHNIKKNRYL